MSAIKPEAMLRIAAALRDNLISARYGQIS